MRSIQNCSHASRCVAKSCKGLCWWHQKPCSSRVLEIVSEWAITENAHFCSEHDSVLSDQRARLSLSLRRECYYSKTGTFKRHLVGLVSRRAETRPSPEEPAERIVRQLAEPDAYICGRLSLPPLPSLESCGIPTLYLCTKNRKGGRPA